jgi:hypothetical protein
MSLKKLLLRQSLDSSSPEPSASNLIVAYLTLQIYEMIGAISMGNCRSNYDAGDYMLSLV